MKRLITASYILFSPGVFAAAASEPMDVWSEELAQYEADYNNMRDYFNEPVDESRVPSNATFLGVQDGYRRYQLPDTSAYLFGVTSSEQRKNLLEKIDFLFRLICSCGQQYSIKPIDVQLDRVLQHEFSSKEQGLVKIMHYLCDIANRLKNRDYLDERELYKLYEFIDSILNEANKSKSSNDLIDQMYVPIKNWIKNNFPISSMLNYIENRIVELSSRASGEVKLSVNSQFIYAKYFNEYHSQTPEYKKITEWLDGSKVGFLDSEDKIIADRELKNFEHEIKVPFDASRLPVGMGDNEFFVEFIRYVESLHQKGEALLEKWIGVIDAEKEEAKRSAQKRAVERRAQMSKPKKADPEEALAAMMRALGLEEDDQPKKSSSTAKKGAQTQKETKPTAAPKDAKVELERQRKEEAERVRALREAEEAERLVRLEAIKRENAERNAAAEARQAEVRERREQAQLNRRIIMNGLLRREATWIEVLYAEGQNLGAYNSSELIDPSIFRGQPDYKTVSNALKAVGVYIKEHVHGNEKCVAMWKDQNDKNIMVWFDDPHGAQLIKGAAAGWVISLHKALRDSGRLRSE